MCFRCINSSTCQVIHADCRDVLPTLKSGWVDFVLTDPPYGVNLNNGDLNSKIKQALGRGKDRHRRPIANDTRDKADELVRFAFAETNRLLAPGCCCCFCCSGGEGKNPNVSRWSQWMDDLLGLKHIVVWDKGPMGLGWHYRRSYETVLVGQKPGAACRWYDETHRVENIIRPGAYGIKKVIPTKDDHPTPKPVALAKHFLQLHTQPGDLVLDPFCGAGWVGVACMELGRRFIGIEVDKHWAAVAKQRVMASRKISQKAG